MMDENNKKKNTTSARGGNKKHKIKECEYDVERMLKGWMFAAAMPPPQSWACIFVASQQKTQLLFCVRCVLSKGAKCF